CPLKLAFCCPEDTSQSCTSLPHPVASVAPSGENSSGPEASASLALVVPVAESHNVTDLQSASTAASVEPLGEKRKFGKYPGGIRLTAIAASRSAVVTSYTRRLPFRSSNANLVPSAENSGKPT